jgi:type I restriction enzyme S subunit
MGNYQGYQKYQDSGVEWLGDIPEHWEAVGLTKYLQSLVDYRGKTPEKTKDGIFLVTAKNIKNGIIDYSLSQEFIKEDEYDEIMRRGKPEIGDVLLTTEAPLGEVANVDNTNIALAQRVIKMRGKIGVLYNYFLKYWILGASFSQNIQSLCTGSTALGIKASKLCLLKVVLPPLNEQEKIAQFLDYKTKQIDELIKKKETLIEKLDEKRTAIISHAVTKGLDSSVPIKDSGVEWLGDIPKHWEVKRLRYIGSCQNGISKGADYFGFGYPFVNYTDVYANIELPKTVSGLANSTDMDRINYSVQKGDIFFTRTSETIEEIGITSTCFNSINNATFSGFLIRVRPFPNLLFTGFSKYYFRCQLHRLFFVKEMNLVTRASLSQELLKRLPVLLPTIEEQKQISKHLDQKTAQIDQQKAKIKQAIELLKEYRTSLITNAVTGKIDVSQIAVP